MKNITTMGKDWKDQKIEWLGNYTLGGYSTLSMSPDPIKLKQLSAEKGHLLEVLGDNKYSQDEPMEQTIVQQRPITHRISQFASWRLHYTSFFEYLINSSDKESFSVETSTAGPTTSTSPAQAPTVSQHAQAATVSQGVENADEGDAGDKQTSRGNDATAGPPSGTSPSQAATVSQGVENAGEGESSDKQPSSDIDVAAGTSSGTSPAQAAAVSQGVEKAGEGDSSDKPVGVSLVGKSSTASFSSGEIKDLIGESPKRKRKRKRSLSRKGRRRRKGKDPDATVKGRRSMSLKAVSKSLVMIAPNFIDLADASISDDTIEESVALLDEGVKNQCIVVFLQYLKSNMGKIGGKVKATKNPRNPSSDERTEETDHSSNVVVGRTLDGTEEGTPANDATTTHTVGKKLCSNIATSTQTVGKQLYSQSRGKSLRPPIPTVARGHFGGKSFIPVQGDYDSDSSSEQELDQQNRSDNKTQSYEGKTPEDERDEGDGHATNKSSEENLHNEMGAGRESEDNKSGDDSSKDISSISFGNVDNDTIGVVDDITNDTEMCSHQDESVDPGRAHGKTPSYEGKTPEDERDEGDGHTSNKSSEENLHGEMGAGHESEGIKSIDDTSGVVDDIADTEKCIHSEESVDPGRVYGNTEVDRLQSFFDDSPVPRGATARRRPPKRRCAN